MTTTPTLTVRLVDCKKEFDRSQPHDNTDKGHTPGCYDSLNEGDEKDDGDDGSSSSSSSNRSRRNRSCRNKNCSSSSNREDSTDTVVVHESGLTSIPLVLEIAGSSIQHSVYAWHTQARVHALCSPPPPLLLLQLKRFRSTNTFATVKDRTHVMVQAGEIVRVHCFYNDVDTSTFMQQYRVVGTVFPVGTELKAGQYKAALSGAIRQSRQHAFYVTDDNKPLLRLKQAAAEMHEGVYIVGLQRL